MRVISLLVLTTCLTLLTNGLRKPVYSVCCIKVARYLTLDINKAEVSARHGKVYCQRNDCIRYSHDAWVDDVS